MTPDPKATLAALAIGEKLAQPAPAQQEQPSGAVHELLAEQLNAHQSKWLTWNDLTGGPDAA